ncbi:MAG: hypothetical protein K2X35_02610 [Bryobacteraceae bacterium]|nr:hypothetical protein [Bryobacteraceae bacterium]
MKLTIASLCGLALLAQQLDTRVVEPRHATSVRDGQELATVIRSAAEIRDVRISPDGKQISFTGSPDQLAMMSWLASALDVPADRSGEPVEFVTPSAGDLVRVHYLPGMPPSSFQELGTVARSVSRARRLFTYRPSRAILVRGTNQEVALAGWLIQELHTNPRSARDFAVPGAAGDWVRIFPLDPGTSVERLQALGVAVRNSLDGASVYAYNAGKALVLRDTQARIAEAERIIAREMTP